jgi:hypothetical protein
MVFPTRFAEVFLAGVTPDKGWFSADSLLTKMGIALAESTVDGLTGVFTWEFA